MSLLAGLTPPLTEQAEDIDRVWNGFLVAALVVGALVWGLIAFVVIRYRRRSGALPSQVREHIPLEIAYTVVPLLIVIALFVVTFTSVRAIDEVDDDVDLTVEVIGFQWQWRFNYPDAGVAVVGTETELPELVLPAGAAVQFDVTSIDVVHSFWIPGFRYKRDMFPGEVQTFQVDITGDVGDYPDSGICAEFCGLDHHKMRFDVRIVDQAEFEQWLEAQR